VGAGRISDFSGILREKVQVVIFLLPAVEKLSFEDGGTARDETDSLLHRRI
jgi:hypothetical protein